MIVRRLRLASENSTDVEQVLNEFFTESNGCYRQERVDFEINKYAKLKKGQVKAGKASGKARKEKGKKAESVPSSKPSNDAACERALKSVPVSLNQLRTKNQELRTKNQELIVQKTSPTVVANGVLEHDGEYLNLFDQFWQAYPKKADKVAAQKAWDKLKPDSRFAEALINDCQKRVELGEWELRNKQFIPSAGPYLNGKKYENEIIPRNGTPVKTDYQSLRNAPDEPF